MLCAIALAWPVSAPRVGHAQGDWDIKRERRAPPKPNKRAPRPARPKRRAEPDRPARDRTDVLIARYRRVLEGDPADAVALRRLLELHRERDGNIDALIEDLEEQRADRAKAYGPRLVLGQIYERARRIDEAREAYEEAMDLRPEEPAPLVALARIHRKAADDDRARELLERALEHTRADADRRELLRELGELALEQEAYDDARGYYNRLMRGARGSVYVRTEYARALTARGEHDRAVEEYERVLRKLRGDRRVLPPVLRDMGRAQLEAGRVDAAIDTLERGLRLAPAGAGVRPEIYDVMIEAYRRAGRLDELAERLDDEASGFETYQLLGRVHDELGNEDEALAAYRRALRIDRRHIDTRIRVVQLLSRAGRLEDVIDEYRTLIRVAPREPRFVVELAQLLMQVGRREEAMQLAAKTSRRYPRDVTVHQALAELYGEWGEDELATREVQRLVRVDPTDPSHLIVLGAQQLAEGDRKAAIATWRRILSTDPNKARAHATLGGVFADHDMLAEAEEAYREAVRLEPDEVDHVRGLASLLEQPREHERHSERRARDDEASKLWARVLELAEDDAMARREARNRIVAIAARRHELPARMSKWRRAFSGEPPDLTAGRFLAQAHLRQRPRELDEAAAVLERVVEHAPGDVASLAELERVRTAQGDLPGAIDVLRRLVDADPRKATHYLQRMAEHALSLYQDTEAVEYAEMAVQRTPDDASAHRRLGDLYRARQDVDHAIESYRRAIDLNERLFPTYFDLAELHLAQGEVDQADRLLRQVMRSSPDDDLVARAGRASIQIHMGAGTLAELEQDLLPLALSHSRRPVYRRLVVELYDALTRPWIRAVEQEGDGAEEAREALGALGKRAIKPLLEGLADPDPAQQRIAISVLGHIGNPNAAGPLLSVAEGRGEASLRARALTAAGVLAEARLAPRFVELAQGSERRLRERAAWSLARMGGRQAVRAMRDLLTHPDPGVRAFAALGLARAGDRASAEAIATLQQEDRNAHAQAAAAWALGALGGSEHVPLLIQALRARSGSVARAAARALGRLGGARARRALAQDVFAPEVEQREVAAGALAELAAPTSTEGSDWFPAPEPTVSAGDYIARLVAQSGRRAVGEVDLRALEDDLRHAATEALGGPVERVLAALAVLTPEPDAPEVVSLGVLTAGVQREGRLGVLADLGRALAPELVALVRQPDPEVRERAVRLLGRLDHPAVAVALVQALGDSESSVQRAALAVVTPHHARAEAALPDRVAQLLRHSDWSVRTEAAQALGRLESRDAADVLARALREDDYAFVREAAARSLGRLGGSTAEAALERAATRDPEPRVRRAAAKAGP